jgi:zinc transporter
MSEHTEALLAAYRLDGHGGGTALDLDGIHATGDGVVWVHLHREAHESRIWIENASSLDPILCEALLSEESRPRCEPYGDGLLLCLRGVNLNPNADPEDMIALVIWVEPRRIISVRRRKVMAVDAIRQSIERGQGPTTAGDFVASVVAGLVERMGPVITALDDRVDALEEAIIEGQMEGIRFELAGVRREAIALRRYIAPQREAMARLTALQAEWLSPCNRKRVREVTDRITRYVEDLDAARERAQIAQDELTNRLSEQINRNMYTLSIVAAVFLPLGLLTGYLGINVGGIPGEKWEWAFIVVGALLIAFAVIELWIFRRLKWF